MTSLLYGSSVADNLIGTTAADSILGNAGNDILIGGAGSDTLIGGKGNDTLTSGAGNDLFIYKSGDGNDVITDYTASDKISITGGSYTKSTVGNDIKIKVGSGSILLKDAKNKNVNISTSTSNSNSSFIERWFIEDNNFYSTDMESILNNDSNIVTNARLIKTNALTTNSDSFADALNKVVENSQNSQVHQYKL